MKAWRIWRKVDGAIAVEFALVFPIMCVILIGIVDFANYLHEKMQLDAVARACVQYVVQGGNPANIQTDVLDHSDTYAEFQKTGQGFNYTGTLSCSCSSGASVNCTTGSCSSGDYVRSFYTVSISSNYPTILPWTGFPNTIAMQGYARMQYNR